MNVLSDFIIRVDDAISFSDANFAAPKTRKTVKKAPARTARKPAAAKKTVKTKTDK